MIFDSFGITILYIGIILLFTIHKFVSPVARYKQVLLLLANILILSYLIPLFTIFTTAVVASLCYAAALYFQRNGFDSQKRRMVWLSLLGCLSVLVVWWVLLKYNVPGHFLRSSHLLGSRDIDRFISTIGLSYIFFKFIHVLVDAYRGELGELDPVTYLNYLFFFPTFLSGPIDRYQNFCRWTKEHSLKNQGLLFRAALFRIFEGVVKKFIFVPLLIGYAKDFGQVHISQVFLVNIAISLMAYSFYLFFDFSGYSDLAIGVAMLLGFKVPENFNSPYLSSNIAEFWKRWHISLSSVLREYIFIPLVRGISKRFAKVPRLVGTVGGYLATFLICGTWHGNTINFVFWGLWHGIGLSVHKLWCAWIKENAFLKEHIFQKWQSGRGKFFQTAITVFSVGITFCYVSLGWLFFNYSVDQIRSVGEISKLKMVAQPYYFYGKSYTWGVRLKYRPISAKDKMDVDIRNKGEKWVHYVQNITTSDKVLNIYGIKNKAMVNPEMSYNSLPPGQYELRLRYRRAGNLSACRITLPVTIPDYTKHANLYADDLEAKACRIAHTGWGIKLKYHPPSRGTRVDIEYRPLGSKLWVRYQHQQRGRYQVTHIMKGNVLGKTGLKPGVYCIRIRYTDINKGFFSDWTELSVRIPDRSVTSGENNDEIS